MDIPSTPEDWIRFFTVAGLQAIPFFITIMALAKLVFFPTLDYLKERDAAIEDGRREAADLEAQVAERLAEVERRLESARNQVGELRARRRAEALAGYEARVAQGRSAAEARLAAALAELKGEESTGRTLLEQTARNLADEIAGRVLGRSLAAG